MSSTEIPNNSGYLVAGKRYTLNTDMTLRERTEVARIFSSVTVSEGVITSEMSAEDARKLLRILLVPVGHDVPAEVEEIRESVELEVIKDFFLSRAGKTAEIKSSLMSSTASLSGQPMS